MKTKLFIALTCLSIALTSTLVFAKEIQMYDQPADNAKPVGKLDLSAGIIPIHVEPKGQWVKVGDPRNGNVGWVRVNEVNNNDNSSVTVTQKIINDGKGGPYQVQSVEFGQPAKIMTQEQTQAQTLEWQKQQQNLQQIQQNIYQNMLNWIHEMNDPTGANRELINRIGNTVPKMVPPIMSNPIQTMQQISPQAAPPKKPPTTERIIGQPGEPPKPGSSLERPARESTQPTEGLPATQPQTGVPTYAPAPAPQPTGP